MVNKPREKLDAWRKRVGLLLDDIADRANVSRMTVSYYLSGKEHTYGDHAGRWRTLRAICDVVSFEAEQAGLAEGLEYWELCPDDFEAPAEVA